MPPQLRSLTASAPFHVCERSGFSPDRADYLSRQAKLNFTSLERHHKASLSGSPPRSPNEPTPTHTHTQKQRASLTDICRRKPVTCRCHPNRLLSDAMWPQLKSSNEDTRVKVRPCKYQHLENKPVQRPLCAAIISIQLAQRARTPLVHRSVLVRQLPLLYFILLYPESRKAAAAWLHRCILGKNQNGWFSVSHLFARSQLVFF